MTTETDSAAIAALTQKFLASWAYHDADSLADLFTEDGTMILAGVFCKGRDEVRAYFEDAFKGHYKGTQVAGKPIGLRFLGPDAAILQSVGGVLEPGETEVSEKAAIRATWSVVRRDGEWRVIAYQNTPRHA